ncbi:serine protease FAM111A-like [Cyprinodon tularosa]|uniref:serine protease FAM111A-like n=1 Tax=Cyprinodon tularosa TaxID=77115 RepID=UPI0018E1FC5F|nr:serine protease FAM111A-like [Cyprinodon tularosa]
MSGVPEDENPNKDHEEKEIKKEEIEEPQGVHKHRFNVKFKATNKIFPVTCRKPGTVLDAIKNDHGDKLEKMRDNKIIIQLGTEDKKHMIATHFPCCLVKDEEYLCVSSTKETVEEVQEQHDRAIQPKDDYSVFYIDTIGGVNAKSKKKFRNTIVKEFKYLCVYGEKGMKVQEALRRDGRFCELEDFELSDNADKPVTYGWKTYVEDLDHKELKICLSKGKNVSKGNFQPPTEQQKQQKQAGSTETCQSTHEARPYLENARDSGKRVGNILKELRSDKSEDVAKREEIYKQLREQFPELKRWMESRFSPESYQKALKHEKFGKTQQSFSEVYRLQKLLEMGKSVCKIVVSGVCQGTGFVLFDNLILTNAHLFRGHHEGKVLSSGKKVSALFDYDIPQPETRCYYFYAENTFVDIDQDLDYAILKLKPEGEKLNPKTKEKDIKIPPGLLKSFTELPKNGEACIIGHPAGEVKKLDPTCIIEPENRPQAVNHHLAPYQGTLFTITSIVETIRSQGIEQIMQMNVGTYNTFMYHGASGSPVFEANCNVFGLHTGGFTYGFEGHKESVIEYAKPLLTIFEKFVNNLKESGDTEMLEKVKKQAQKNENLQRIIDSAEQDAEEPMYTS